MKKLYILEKQLKYGIIDERDKSQNQQLFYTFSNIIQIVIVHY